MRGRKFLERNKQGGNGVKTLAKYLRGYEKESVIAPLFKMLEAAFDLLVPLVMASIINRGIAAGDRTFILQRCGLLIILGLIGLACSITAQYFAAKAAVGFSTQMRHALFAHIQTLGFAEMDKLGISTLITRMTSDVNQVQSGLNLFLRLFLRSPFIVIGSVVMAFLVNARAALIFVVTIPVLSVVVFGIMLWTMPLFRKVQGRLDKLLGMTRENLTGVRVVRAFGREELEKERFEQANEALVQGQILTGKISALMNPLTYVIVNLAVIVILHTGAVQIHAGAMQAGDVVALVNYMSQVLIELVKLANLIIQVTKALACADRVASVLQVKPEMAFARADGAREKGTMEPNDTKDAGRTGAKQNAAESAREAVAFDHVSFAYAGAGGEALSDVHLSVKRGQTIGVIGGTGSGKSTFVSLIPRFYDATKGEVRIDGRNIRDYSKEALRKKIGVVPQKAQLFSGTIRSNLLWGNENAAEQDLWDALETAQAAEFVRAKEQGLDEEVEQGGRNLSGGQRQRLTIARALAAKPEILILDDSASALDFATDAALRRAIRALGDSLTVFIVSQRASSIRYADQILVLDDGKVVGSGTHETLLETCAVYREIYESQFRKAGEQ